MRKGDKKLSLEEREQLAILRAQGTSLREIGRILGRSHSSLSRELRRYDHGTRIVHYTPCIWHDLARAKQLNAGRPKSLQSEEARRYIEEKLSLGWSPELISGRMAQDMPGHAVSHETIYQYIYREAHDLVGYLPRRHVFRRKKRAYRKPQQSHIPNRLSIDTRPEEINQRRHFGHWESDLVVSGKSTAALAVMVERKSRYAKIVRIPDKTSSTVSKAIVTCLKEFDERVRLSITYDNGMENVLHEEVNRQLGTQSYFCNPYHSWEKGSVENINGLIRRFIHKKMDLASVSDEQIQRIESRLNNRPKKCLDYRTPKEVLNSFLPLVHLNLERAI